MRKRKKALILRLDEAELAMLRALVTRSGLSASDVLRQAIRQQHAKLRALR